MRERGDDKCVRSQCITRAETARIRSRSGISWGIDQCREYKWDARQEHEAIRSVELLKNMQARQAAANKADTDGHKLAVYRMLSNLTVAKARKVAADTATITLLAKNGEIRFEKEPYVTHAIVGLPSSQPTSEYFGIKRYYMQLD